jgi:nucleotide-binding universal stress UspA family protein
MDADIAVDRESRTPREGILKLVREQSAGQHSPLLVLVTRRHHRFHRFFRSLTRSLLAEAVCPILIFPSPRQTP